MEEFTQRLLEKSKARKDFLNSQKLPELRKRRTLIDENQIAFSGLEFETKADDSPKRLCLNSEYDGSSYGENSFEDKENLSNSVNEDLPFVPFVASEKKGLAALRKRNYEETEESLDVPETKESQGFVKSPSKVKLSYNFPKKNESEEELSDEEMSEENEDQALEENAPTELISHEITREKIVTPDAKNNNFLNSDLSKRNNITPKKIENNTTEIKSTPLKEKNVREVSSQKNEDIDPADLPLSARKALFEKAMFNSATKPETNLTPNLSIAQRAALFEKGSQSENLNKYQNQKPKVPTTSNSLSTPSRSAINVIKNSPIKIATTPNKLSVSPINSPRSPVEITVLSPSKNAGIHTRSIQQRLIENSSSDWRKKDIVAKANNERKNEISALLSHWEKVSSSEKSVSEIDQNLRSIASSEPEKNVSGYSENSGDFQESYNEMMDDDDNEMMDDSDNDVSTHEEVFLPQEENEAEKVSSIITNDDLTECDEVFKSPTNKITNTLPPPPPQPRIVPSSTSFSSKGSSISYTSSSTESTVSTPREISKYQSPIIEINTDASSETPLLHTISFYRKQKQKKSKPSVPTIVRKEEIPSPPSPEVDTTKLIHEKIKVLQEEILSQQTVISQTSRALNLCHSTEEFFGSTEQVEGERLLLIATQKRQAALNEIHRLKTHGALGEKLEFGSGTLLIHDITLPLKRDFIASQVQQKDNDAVHYFMCLVRYGHQVIVTQMLSTLSNDVNNGSLCFTNHITLRNLPPDFSIVFEVYALQTKKEVLTHAKKYHIKKEHSKIRLTPKSKKESKLQMPTISSPGGPNAVRTPSFGVVGYARFTLQNYDRKTYTLEQVPFSSPLDGVLLVKMQLHCERNITERGFLTMFEDVSGLGAWHRRWCVLNNNYLSFWKYPDEEKKKNPMLQIDMRQCITSQVKLVSRDICARAHTFEVVIVRPQEDGDKNTLISRSINTLTTTKYLLSADTKEERILWCKRLNEALTNIRRWNPKAMRPIDIKL